MKPSRNNFLEFNFRPWIVALIPSGSCIFLNASFSGPAATWHKNVTLLYWLFLSAVLVGVNLLYATGRIREDIHGIGPQISSRGIAKLMTGILGMLAFTGAQPCMTWMLYDFGGFVKNAGMILETLLTKRDKRALAIANLLMMLGMGCFLYLETEAALEQTDNVTMTEIRALKPLSNLSEKVQSVFVFALASCLDFLEWEWYVCRWAVLLVSTAIGIGFQRVYQILKSIQRKSFDQTLFESALATFLELGFVTRKLADRLSYPLLLFYSYDVMWSVYGLLNSTGDADIGYTVFLFGSFFLQSICLIYVRDQVGIGILATGSVIFCLEQPVP